MSPIFIRLLMALHYSPEPLREYGTRAQILGRACEDALAFFYRHGFLAPGVDFGMLFSYYERSEILSRPALSDKGRALVARICSTSWEDL